MLPILASLLLLADVSDAAEVLVDIGGRRLHMSCAGTGQPTVILEAGFGDSSTTWTSVQPAIAEITRVCAYDRAGRGASDPDLRTEPRTGRSAVEDLHALLASASEAGPYVLVGHSLGGAYVRLYAQRFPQAVVGMVLVDATHEDQLLRRRAVGYSPPPLPSPRDNVERTDMLAVLDELREARWRAPIPLVVLAADRSEPGAYPGASAELVARLDAVCWSCSANWQLGLPRGVSWLLMVVDTTSIGMPQSS